jgi:hypothetical protein
LSERPVVSRAHIEDVKQGRGTPEMKLGLQSIAVTPNPAVSFIAAITFEWLVIALALPRKTYLTRRFRNSAVQ